MIKRLITYIAMALVLLGCSTDDILLPNGVGEDGSLEINLAVPELESVATRADNFSISSIRMLVFDNNGTLQQLSDDLADDLVSYGAAANHTYKLKVNLKKEIRGQSGLQFYFIANYATEIIPHLNERETVLDDLLDVDNELLTYNTPLASNQTVRMSGKGTLADLTSQASPVQLFRNSAKITVTDKAAGSDGPGTTNYPFNAYGFASQASIFAGAEPSLMGSATEPEIAGAATVADGDAQSDELFVHPTTNDIDSRLRPFIIIKAPYGGTNYFYRVDFRRFVRDEDGNIKEPKKLEDLDIKPNHWYKFIVEEITGAGDATEAQAALHPSSLITIDILDVTPKSYNMVTDGSRELGVSHELIHEEKADGNNVEDFYIKLFSPDSSEYPAATVAAFENIVSLSDDWMGITAVADVTGTADGGNLGSGAGKVYKVSVEFTQTKSPGTLEGEISVDWKGLNRVVPVVWRKVFKGSDLCDVKLTVKGYEKSGTGEAVTYSAATILNKVDYWDFLDKAEGVSADANLGTARNEGLHFPLMYGDTGHEWEYEYEVTFHKIVEGEYRYRIYSTGSIINTGYAVKQGPSGTDVTGTATGELTVTVTKPTNSWLYTYGEMVFAIYNTTTKKWDEFPIDLYHTGFFHNHGTSSAAKWYYYEVLGDEAGNYWLDRNLLAKAAGACMVESDGSATGLEDALGDYLRVAEYNNSIDNEPKMKDNICPPGFMIPREEIWNSLRNSNNFIRSTSGGTYNSYLISNVNGRRIYFPRGRYKDSGDSYSGEPRAGYYWSSTPSAGFEKEELGNWLQAFVISGNITSYVPAEVGRTNHGWAMSVRCVNSTSDSKNMYRTYFSVQGATHVFLYNMSNGQRTSATTWPGKAIGDYTTMTPGQVMSFVLDSPTTAPGDWYVIFNYKDANGKIHSYSKSPTGGTLYSDNKDLKELTGWKVVGEDINGITSSLGGTWTVNYPSTGPAANVSFATGNQIDETTKYRYRIYWPYDVTEWNGVQITKNTETYGSVTSYTGFKDGNELTVTNGKFKKYSNSLAFLEFEVSRTQLSGTYTCRMVKGNNQAGSTCTFTIPSVKDADGCYSYTFDPQFGQGKNGKPDYFYINCYDLEGWGSMSMTLQTSSNGTIQTLTGEKMYDYWPVMYRFKISYNDQIDKFRFYSGTNSVTAGRGGQSFVSIDNGYYNNGASSPALNKVEPSAVTKPEGSMRRIALRAIDGASWSNYYIYDWGGTNGASAANSKQMTKIESGGKVYYYLDIANNATGFLFTDGNFNDGDNKGHQTNDISDNIGSKWQAGKLVQQWYTPGFSVQY